MKRILGILVILALALSLNAIVLAENEEILIGFSPTTLTNEYFSAVQGSIEKACEKLNIKLISYDPQGDATTQATQIDDMISMGIQALIYIPIDSAGGRTVMQSCKDAGVFVINIDNVVIEEDRACAMQLLLPTTMTSAIFLASIWLSVSPRAAISS